MAKRQHLQNAARLAATRSAAAPGTLSVDPANPNDPNQLLLLLQQQQMMLQQQPGFQPSASTSTPLGNRHPWEHIDEIHAILKTAFPLLALSMEMIVDQVSTRFKPLPDEDIYRLISALLADGIQVGLPLSHRLSKVLISLTG